MSVIYIYIHLLSLTLLHMKFFTDRITTFRGWNTWRPAFHPFSGPENLITQLQSAQISGLSTFDVQTASTNIIKHPPLLWALWPSASCHVAKKNFCPALYPVLVSCFAAPRCTQVYHTSCKHVAWPRPRWEHRTLLEVGRNLPSRHGRCFAPWVWGDRQQTTFQRGFKTEWSESGYLLYCFYMFILANQGLNALIGIGRILGNLGLQKKTKDVTLRNSM